MRTWFHRIATLHTRASILNLANRPWSVLSWVSLSSIMSNGFSGVLSLSVKLLARGEVASSCSKWPSAINNSSVWAQTEGLALNTPHPRAYLAFSRNVFEALRSRSALSIDVSPEMGGVVEQTTSQQEYIKPQLLTEGLSLRRISNRIDSKHIPLPRARWGTIGVCHCSDHISWSVAFLLFDCNGFVSRVFAWSCVFYPGRFEYSKRAQEIWFIVIKLTFKMWIKTMSTQSAMIHCNWVDKEGAANT